MMHQCMTQHIFFQEFIILNKTKIIMLPYFVDYMFTPDCLFIVKQAVIYIINYVSSVKLKLSFVRIIIMKSWKF